MQRLFMILAGVNLLTGLVLSAYGAHGLPMTMTESARNAFQSATLIQMLHGLGLGLIGLSLAQTGQIRLLGTAGWLQLVGIVLFSGGIYAKTLLTAPGVGPLVPWGGTALMISWLLFVVAWIIGSPETPKRG